MSEKNKAPHSVSSEKYQDESGAIPLPVAGSTINKGTCNTTHPHLIQDHLAQNIQTLQDGNRFVLFDALDFPEFTFEIFSSAYWERHHMLTGKASGRGTAWFFKFYEKEYVLRRYLRGGAIGRLLSDQFFHLHHASSRSWQEFKVLQQLRAWGLPAPRPVAALVKKSGIVCRSFIITERIQGARDLHQLLQEKRLTETDWINIGAVIRAFHDHQLYHHDLNIRNIMLDAKQQPWLIDFDKCHVKKGNQWKQENLSRLRRSFIKEIHITPNLYFSLADFDLILSGYHA